MKRWIDWLGIELDVVSQREKLVAAVGGFLSILVLVAISLQTVGEAGATAVVGSMGASGVLLFAVPRGPLSQPWPVIGGHCVSALIGVGCARWLPQPAIAAGCAVGLSILMMHQLKCIHPPGGATALTAVLGGTSVQDLGFLYAVMPVLANCLAMVGLAFAFNWWFAWRRYPSALRSSVGKLQSTFRAQSPTHEEVVAALRQLDVFVDVSEKDLIELCRLLAPAHTLEVRPVIRSAA